MAKGFLHPTHSRSVRVAGVWYALSVLILVGLIVIGVIDDLLFGRIFFPVLRPLGIAALVSCGIGLVLIVLSTNRII